MVDVAPFEEELDAVEASGTTVGRMLSWPPCYGHSLSLISTMSL